MRFLGTLQESALCSLTTHTWGDLLLRSGAARNPTPSTRSELFYNRLELAITNLGRKKGHLDDFMVPASKLANTPIFKFEQKLPNWLCASPNRFPLSRKTRQLNRLSMRVKWVCRTLSSRLLRVVRSLGSAMWVRMGLFLPWHGSEHSPRLIWDEMERIFKVFAFAVSFREAPYRSAAACAQRSGLEMILSHSTMTVNVVVLCLHVGVLRAFFGFWSL